MGPELPLQRVSFSGGNAQPTPPFSTGSGGLIPSPNDSAFVHPQAGNPAEETCKADDPNYESWVLSLT
jgi:hypothetical protein